MLNEILGFVRHITGIGVLGVAAAFAAKYFGIEKSVFATATTGVFVGWLAFWLSSVLLTPSINAKVDNNSYGPRKAPLQQDSDKTITLQTPLSTISASRDKERP